MLGCGMTSQFALAWFHSANMPAMMVNDLGVSAAGALACAATLAVHRGLTRISS